MLQLEVRELEGAELRAWDMLVAGSAQGTVFHTSDWLVKNASLQSQDLVLLGCYEGEELIGGCPLYLSRPYNLLRLASSTAALTPYGGVVVTEIERAKQRRKEVHVNRIIAALLEYIAQLEFDYVNLVNSPGLTDIRAFTRRGWNPVVYYTYILPLHDDIFKTVSKDVRQNIRKAQKQGISSTRKFDPGIFWDLMVRTFEKQGKQTPVSERHLAGMLAMIQEKGIGEMRVASTSSGEMAAAEVTVWDAKMAHSWSAAAAPEHLPTGAASLLCHDTFTSLKERGFSAINLMAGNLPHLSTFISGFNPGLVPYYGVDHTRLRYRILKRLRESRYPGSPPG
ncbi:GNAT family N-acetyltransferase [Methanoculleus bourgensis]|uniref:GNAT family N-acetyltransferase n=1 Tax=Methanoculleus bourgensis TaxID=83986 RepID=UPI001BDA380B|nr:GNAT family N-acetyltransferase [Methanoculleus bourgensis]MBT0732277.1 GNAT family N-acetyltransferase [Methanoculleus bourgensis]